MEVVVTTDVTEANEPLLKEIRSGGETWINQYIKYPTDGANADEIALIKDMCIAARELAEKELNRALASKTLTVYWELDEAKRQDFKVALPYGPISSISSVHVVYADDTADLALTENDDYYIYGNQYQDVWLAEIYGTAGTGEVAGYKISYVCGYDSTDCEGLPKAIKVIMASQMRKWYSKRDGIYVLDIETKKALQQFSRKSWI